MDVVIAYGQWVLVALLFSSVAGAGKLLIDRTKPKSASLCAALLLWAIVGSLLFFTVFCRVTQGNWLWE